jgi:hypothetical protein
MPYSLASYEKRVALGYQPAGPRGYPCQPAPHSGKPQTVLAILQGRGGRVQVRQAD